MPRVYLTLLPIPVLAAIVAFAACSRPADPVTHVIPAAAPYEQAAPPMIAAKPPTAESAPTIEPADDKPSEEDIREFQRRVPK